MNLLFNEKLSIEKQQFVAANFEALCASAARHRDERGLVIAQLRAADFEISFASIETIERAGLPVPPAVRAYDLSEPEEFALCMMSESRWGTASVFTVKAHLLVP